MKKLVYIFLSVALIIVAFYQLSAFAQPEGDDGPDGTFWGRMGFETVDECMEWYVDIGWYGTSAEVPFWLARYMNSKEEFMEEHGLDEGEYQVLEEAWQRALKKAQGERAQHRTRELEGLGGTPGIINVIINGDFIKFDGDVPEIVDELAFVPAKPFFEALGATASYDAQTYGLTASFDGWSVGVVAGRDTVSITESAGAEHELPIDIAPYINVDVLYIPVRAVAEELGYDVFWDRAFRAVVIIEPDRVVSEIDKDFAVVNSLFEMASIRPPVGETTYKTVLEMLISITRLNSLDGDNTSNVTADISILSDGLNFSMAGVVDLSALAGILFDENMHGAFDDEGLPEIFGQLDELGDIEVELIFNYDEGMMYIKAPILSAFAPEVPEGAWVSIGGLDEYSNAFALEGLMEELGLSAFAEGMSIGAIIYSNALPNNNYVHYEDDYNNYSGYTNPIYLYSEVMANAAFAKALIGDDKFVKNGDDFILALTLEELLAAEEEFGMEIDSSEFDLKIAIRTKDGEIMGIDGEFLYREIKYYGYSETRYACKFDINQAAINFDLEIHEKNSQIIRIGIESETSETNMPVQLEPPEGDKVIPFEDIIGMGEEYSPGFVTPLSVGIRDSEFGIRNSELRIRN